MTAGCPESHPEESRDDATSVLDDGVPGADADSDVGSVEASTDADVEPDSIDIVLDGPADEVESDGSPPCTVEWVRGETTSSARHRALAVAMSDTTVVYVPRDAFGSALIRTDRSTGTGLWSVSVRPALAYGAAVVWTGAAFLAAIQFQAAEGTDGLWTFVVGDGNADPGVSTEIHSDGMNPSLAVSADGRNVLLGFFDPIDGAFVVELDAATGAPRSSPVHVDDFVGRMGVGVGRRPAGDYWLARIHSLSVVTTGSLDFSPVDTFDLYAARLASDGGAIAVLAIRDTADTLLLWDDAGRRLPDPGLDGVYAIGAYDRFVLALVEGSSAAIFDPAGAVVATVDLSASNGFGEPGSGPDGFVIVTSPADYYEYPTIVVLTPQCVSAGG